MVTYFSIYILILNLLNQTLQKYTVHIIPHSHDDPGWIKTYNEYYVDQVSAILTNTVTSLIESANRTFIFSEVSFFKTWYLEQGDSMRENVKKLISEGRFEFVNGGYVMGDEGVSHITDSIMQIRTGWEFLKNEFNITPHIGWLWDPFGHSKTHAYMYELFGYDKLVIGRTSTKTKQKLIQNKDLEFIWKPFPKSKGIFTHAINEYYCPPSSIRKFVNEDQINFNRKNIKKYADAFYSDIRNALRGFKHNHYIWYYGCDFTFVQKDNNFKNIEALMEYVNEEMSDQYVLKYSTVDAYFKEVEYELSNQKPLFEYDGDFLPLDETGVWSGYFTSRPFLKGRMRECSNLFVTSSLLFLEYSLMNKNQDRLSLNLFKAQEGIQNAIAWMQHHDAVTGTAKIYVNKDYLSIWNQGQDVLMESVITIGKALFNANNMSICLSNGKVDLGCDINFTLNSSSEQSGTDYILGIYNPGVDKKVLFTLESRNSISGFNWNITNLSNGKKLKTDVICVPNYKCFIQFIDIVDREVSFFKYKLTLHQEDKEKNEEKKHYFSEFINSNEGNINFPNNIFPFKNGWYNIKNNLISIVWFPDKTYELKLEHKFGNASGTSGAYISSMAYSSIIRKWCDFTDSYYIENPLSITLYLRYKDSQPKSTLIISIFKNPFLIQIISVFEEYLPSKTMEQIFSVESNINNLDNNNTELKKEFIVYNSEQINTTLFYTDSNGSQMVKRVKNTKNNSVSLALFPISSRICIKDNEKIITVYNDRPQGGTSYNPGEILLVINRKSNRDDYKGWEEILNERESTETSFEYKHMITLDTNADEIDDMIYNYFTRNWLVFPYKTSPVESSEFRMESIIAHVFITPPSIKMSTLYLSEQRGVIQFYNESDDFFSYEYKREILTVSWQSGWKLRECDFNGFNCRELEEHQRWSLGYTRRYRHFRIKAMEYKVFEFEVPN